MPKIKTKRAAAKRFKVTKSGLVKRGAAYRRHILSSKTTKQKRRLRASSSGNYVDKTNAAMVKAQLPYA